MEKSKTLSVLQNFYKVIESDDPTKEEKESICYYQLQLAQAIIEDFHQDAINIAEIILAYCKKNKEVH